MGKIIKWGILGTGNIAHKFALGLQSAADSEIRAVGSRDPHKAGEFADHFHIPAAYGSYDELVRDPEVDVIYIATPHNLHFKNTMLCLENGKNVLCEKPFAVNGKEVRKMIEKAREKNLFLMEAMWTRFLPHIEKAREMISSRELGEIKLLKSDFGVNFPFNENSRIYNQVLIGGSLMDVGIYPVFLSLFLLGKPSLIKAVAGIGPTGVDHNCSISFSYKKDLISILYSSVVAKTDVTSEIHGTKGKIIFDEWWFKPASFHFIDQNGDKTTFNFNFKGNGYNYEAEEVVHCLQQGQKQSNKMSWEDSINLIDHLDAIRKQCGIVYPDHD